MEEVRGYVNSGQSLGQVFWRMSPPNDNKEPIDIQTITDLMFNLVMSTGQKAKSTKLQLVGLCVCWDFIDLFQLFNIFFFCLQNRKVASIIYLFPLMNLIYERSDERIAGKMPNRR